MKIVMATGSFNRKVLFDNIGIEYEMITPTYEEIISDNISCEDQVRLFALEKAKSVLSKLEKKSVCVFGFDSMGDMEGKVIGKCKTKKEAFELWQSYVGKKQRFLSGISMIGYDDKGNYFEKVDIDESFVFFRSDITNCQIRSYLDTDNWKGKSGAYSVSGPALFLIDKIEGDYHNIIGVPFLKMGEMIRNVLKKNPISYFNFKKI